MLSQKNPSDQVPSGYRPLSGTSPSMGTDLVTTTYLVIGISLGIVAGTLAADGSWRAMIPRTLEHSVQASTHIVSPVKPPAAKPGQTQLAEVKPAAQAVPAVAQAVPVAGKAEATAMPPGAQAASAKALVETRTLPGQNIFVPVKASAAHRPTASVRLHARWKRLGRRHHHLRHGLQNRLVAAVALQWAVKAVASPPPAEAPQTSAFTVEGNVTIANYDASSGLIETYEGESFALDASVKPLEDNPADLQYRCDQSWNCTLSRNGGVQLSARRTR